MASVPNSNPPLALEPNPLKFSPGFITDYPPKTSEKILSAEGKSPGLYPAPARQLRQAKLAGPCCAKCILLVTHLCGWVNGTVNYFPTYLNCRCSWDVCTGFAFAREKCNKSGECWHGPMLALSIIVYCGNADEWFCTSFAIWLTARQSAESPAVTHGDAADSSMWLTLLWPPLEMFWGWTGSVLLHAINSPLGLPKKLSQLLVADIFQLPVWNSLWGPTTEFCVCLWVVSWEWADKIALFSHCAHCGYSSKGWDCFSEFIRIWV